MAIAFKPPFPSIYLKEDSQRLLVYCCSVIDPILDSEIKQHLAMDAIRFQDALQELINNKPQYLNHDASTSMISLNITPNESHVLKWLNLNLDYICGSTFENEFTISIIQDSFKQYLEDQMLFLSNDAIYKMIRRAIEKFVAFKFIDKKKKDKVIWFKINLDFFSNTSPQIRIIRYLHQSIAELKSSLKPEKIRSLSVHNLHLYFMDFDNSKLDVPLLKDMIQKNAEKDFIQDNRIKNEPYIYHEENKFGEFGIRVFEGKKSGKPSMEIIISQDKLHHAIPLSRLPFLLGYIDYFLNKEKRFFFKNLDIMKFNVTLIHYNFDFKVKDDVKKELFEREVSKELTLGVYHDHFLFRFYQLTNDEYRFESQISKSTNKIVKAEEITNENEGSIIFRTIRGLMKQSVELVNQQIDTEITSKKILNLVENNSQKIIDVYHLERDMNSNLLKLETEIDNERRVTRNGMDQMNVNLVSVNTNINDLSQVLQSFQVDHKVLNIGLKTFMKDSGSFSQSVMDNFKLTMANLSILSNSLNVLTNQIKTLDQSNSNRIKDLSDQLSNLMIINNFYHEYVIYCDNKAREFVLSILNKISITLPLDTIKQELDNLKEKLKIRNLRIKGSAIYTI